MAAGHRDQSKSIRRSSAASAPHSLATTNPAAVFSGLGQMTRLVTTTLLLSGSASLLLGFGGTAMSQTAAPRGGVTPLPKIEIVAPRRAQPTRRPRKPVTTSVRRETPAAPPPPEPQVLAVTNENSDKPHPNIL